MKKLITLVVFVIIATAANAQFKKGSYMISGDLSASYKSETTKEDGSDKKDETQSTLFSGSVGYFIKNNIAVGGNISFVKPNKHISQTELRAFARYYFGAPKVSSFIPYLQGNLGYAMRTQKYDGKEVKATGIIYGGVGGFNYFLTKNIGLDVGAQYEMSKIKADVKNSKEVNVTRLHIKAGIIFILDF